LIIQEFGSIDLSNKNDLILDFSIVTGLRLLLMK